MRITGEGNHAPFGINDLLTPGHADITWSGDSRSPSQPEDLPAPAGGREGKSPMATVATKQEQEQPVRSTIPARLDRLRWSPFHTRLVLGLGTAWILDGLEITIASSVSGKLTAANTLNLSTTQASAIGTIYLVGEVVGALIFGRLSDKLGRRKLFMWTLAIYLVGTGLS